MNTPDLAPNQMPAEQLAHEAIILTGQRDGDRGVYESHLRSEPNGAKLDTRHGSLPLAPGQLISTYVRHDDGKYGANPVLRYVGEDNHFHDLMRDEQGQLPPVVLKRLENLAVDIPAFTDPMPREPKYLVRGGRTNSFFDPSLPGLHTRTAAESIKAHIPLFKKVALGAAEVTMNAVVSIKSTLFGAPSTAQQHTPKHSHRPQRPQSHRHRPKFA